MKLTKPLQSNRRPAAETALSMNGGRNQTLSGTAATRNGTIHRPLTFKKACFHD
jgi:hypothetical protein